MYITIYYYYYHQQLAYEYASKGACLALTARRKNRLEEVAEIAREVGSPNVVTVHADVSKPDDCRRIVDETISHFGRCKSAQPHHAD